MLAYDAYDAKILTNILEGEFEENRSLAEKVLKWTVKNMQDRKGYFFYQLKKGISSKISYMRWSNAFMFCALSYYLLEQ